MKNKQILNCPNIPTNPTRDVTHDSRYYGFYIFGDKNPGLELLLFCPLITKMCGEKYFHDCALSELGLWREDHLDGIIGYYLTKNGNEE